MNAIVTKVHAALDALSAEHEVRVLMAVESGSRAWGFASPDSDFDVRFVYAHARDWYLSVQEHRDVIERPIDADLLDVGGWDLRKTLRLLLNGNPAILEWLESPIRYREETAFTADLRALADRCPHRVAAAHHYAGVIRSQLKHHFGDPGTVKLKAYFYVLRPALALAWLRQNQGRVPMDLPSLLAQVDLDATTREAIDQLLEAKIALSERGIGKRVAILDSFIAGELDAAPIDKPLPLQPDIVAAADALFRAWIA